MTIWICVKCGKQSNEWRRCECSGFKAPRCNHKDCWEPATRQAYRLGYIANLCERHAQPGDEADAQRFRYAER